MANINRLRPLAVACFFVYTYMVHSQVEYNTPLRPELSVDRPHLFIEYFLLAFIASELKVVNNHFCIPAAAIAAACFLHPLAWTTIHMTALCRMLAFWFAKFVWGEIIENLYCVSFLFVGVSLAVGELPLCAIKLGSSPLVRCVDDWLSKLPDLDASWVDIEVQAIHIDANDQVSQQHAATQNESTHVPTIPLPPSPRASTRLQRKRQETRKSTTGETASVKSGIWTTDSQQDSSAQKEEDTTHSRSVKTITGQVLQNPSSAAKQAAAWGVKVSTLQEAVDEWHRKKGDSIQDGDKYPPKPHVDDEPTATEDADPVPAETTAEQSAPVEYYHIPTPSIEPSVRGASLPVVSEPTPVADAAPTAIETTAEQHLQVPSTERAASDAPHPAVGEPTQVDAATPAIIITPAEETCPDSSTAQPIGVAPLVAGEPATTEVAILTPVESHAVAGDDGAHADANAEAVDGAEQTDGADDEMDYEMDTTDILPPSSFDLDETGDLLMLDIEDVEETYDSLDFEEIDDVYDDLDFEELTEMEIDDAAFELDLDTMMENADAPDKDTMVVQEQNDLPDEEMDLGTFPYTCIQCNREGQHTSEMVRALGRDKPLCPRCWWSNATAGSVDRSAEEETADSSLLPCQTCGVERCTPDGANTGMLVCLDCQQQQQPDDRMQDHEAAAGAQADDEVWIFVCVCCKAVAESRDDPEKVGWVCTQCWQDWEERQAAIAEQEVDDLREEEVVLTSLPPYLCSSCHCEHLYDQEAWDALSPVCPTCRQLNAAGGSVLTNATANTLAPPPANPVPWLPQNTWSLPAAGEQMPPEQTGSSSTRTTGIASAETGVQLVGTEVNVTGQMEGMPAPQPIMPQPVLSQPVWQQHVPLQAPMSMRQAQEAPEAGPSRKMAPWLPGLGEAQKPLAQALRPPPGLEKAKYPEQDQRPLAQAPSPLLQQQQQQQQQKTKKQDDPDDIRWRKLFTSGQQAEIAHYIEKWEGSALDWRRMFPRDFWNEVVKPEFVREILRMQKEIGRATVFFQTKTVSPGYRNACDTDLSALLVGLTAWSEWKQDSEFRKELEPALQNLQKAIRKPGGR